MFGILLSLGLLYYIPLLIMEECKKKANDIHWSQVSRSCNKYPYTCPVDEKPKSEPKPEPEPILEKSEKTDEHKEDETPDVNSLQEWVKANADYLIDILEGQEESVTIPSEKLTDINAEEVVNWLMEQQNVSLAMYDEEKNSIYLTIYDASRM